VKTQSANVEAAFRRQLFVAVILARQFGEERTAALKVTST
jgi:hypothetical protein